MNKSSSTKPPLMKYIRTNKKALIITAVICIGLLVTYIITSSIKTSSNTRASVAEEEYTSIFMENDTLTYNLDEATKKFTAHGAFCFDKSPALGGSQVECYGLHVSTDPEGKNIVASYPSYPGYRSPMEKLPRCPLQLQQWGYPKICEPVTPRHPPYGLPFWLTNWGRFMYQGQEWPHEVHKTGHGLMPHEFEFNGNVPADFPSPTNCILYFHYTSNMQVWQPFFALNFCGPTPTSTPTPTPFMGCPDIRGPFISKSACEELCYYNEGNDTVGSIGSTGSTGGTTTGGYPLANCQPGPNNPMTSQLGEWYCCPGANCGAECTGGIMGEDPLIKMCIAPLTCLPDQDNMQSQTRYTCQDKIDCWETNSCWCIKYDQQLSTGDFPEQPKCNYFGSEICHDYCTTCYSDPGCTTPSTTGAYCKVLDPITP